MAFSTQEIRIGYVPEHYLAPLHLAKSYFQDPVTLVPFPSGTGHMIASLRANEIDLAIGLTEGWVAGLMTDDGQQKRGYSIVGSWCKTPLRWAIVTGKNRDDINSVDDLRQHRRVGVSRIGSGSHIMAFVLAEQQGWLKSDKVSKDEGLVLAPLGPFKDLRDGVSGTETQADFFMWEHFTTKAFWEGENAPLKRIGEIYTPWPAWHIAASSSTFPEPASDPKLLKLFDCFDRGVRDFEADRASIAKRIAQGEFNCDYSESDATEWMKGVQFFDRTRGVDGETMGGVVKVLEVSNIIEPSTEVRDTSGLVGIARD